MIELYCPCYYPDPFQPKWGPLRCATCLRLFAPPCPCYICSPEMTLAPEVSWNHGTLEGIVVLVLVTLVILMAASGMLNSLFVAWHDFLA